MVNANKIEVSGVSPRVDEDDAHCWLEPWDDREDGERAGLLEIGHDYVRATIIVTPSQLREMADIIESQEATVGLSL